MSTRKMVAMPFPVLTMAWYWKPVSTIVQADSSIVDMREPAGHLGNAFAESDPHGHAVADFDTEGETP
jgi:hypothetical protein